MISVKIEKELKGENRVVGSFTFRQALCFSIAIVILGVYYIVVKPTMDMVVPVAMALGAGAWYLGFHKKNGMPTEYFLIKKVKESILMNNLRRYRTKNKYITMLNSGYEEDRNNDYQDKKKKKVIKKRQKEVIKELKKTKMRAYE